MLAASQPGSQSGHRTTKERQRTTQSSQKPAGARRRRRQHNNGQQPTQQSNTKAATAAGQRESSRSGPQRPATTGQTPRRSKALAILVQGDILRLSSRRAQQKKKDLFGRPRGPRDVSGAQGPGKGQKWWALWPPETVFLNIIFQTETDIKKADDRV